jgi:hypothetical protein
MKIKYKKRLVARAITHKREDRFIADQYVRYENGAAEEFKGCEIGCLATPADIPARKAWFKSLDGRFGSGTMVRKIEEDFGVCSGLQRVAELFLVELDSGSSARLGGFTVSFVKAIPEGRDITDELVGEWIDSRALVVNYYPNGVDGRIGLLDQSRYGADMDKERAAFLDWLRRGAPQPRG